MSEVLSATVRLRLRTVAFALIVGLRGGIVRISGNEGSLHTSPCFVLPHVIATFAVHCTERFEGPEVWCGNRSIILFPLISFGVHSR
jgi:hypothetical protein